MNLQCILPHIDGKEASRYLFRMCLAYELNYTHVNCIRIYRESKCSKCTFSRRRPMNHTEIVSHHCLFYPMIIFYGDEGCSSSFKKTTSSFNRLHTTNMINILQFNWKYRINTGYVAFRMIKSAALCLLLVAVVSADDEEYQRDIRQSPIFFQPSRGGPPPKGQQFHGNLVPKFVQFGGAPPQGFRPAPQVDEEEEEEIDKNSIAPSPSTPPQQQVLHFRQSQGPQQVCTFPNQFKF